MDDHQWYYIAAIYGNGEIKIFRSYDAADLFFTHNGGKDIWTLPAPFQLRNARLRSEHSGKFLTKEM